MARWNPYPHGADPSVYPTIEAMRDAYLDARYRDYPRSGWVRLGPWPDSALAAGARPGIDFSDTRPTCHAIVVAPGKVVLLRFARRAALADIERLETERRLAGETPELAAVRGWPVEARLVYCDAFDRIEDAARPRGISLALYSPRLLLRWRDRAGRLPGSGIHGRNFNPESLRRYVELHARRAPRALKPRASESPDPMPSSAMHTD